MNERKCGLVQRKKGREGRKRKNEGRIEVIEERKETIERIKGIDRKRYEYYSITHSILIQTILSL
jgi:hypothetical protein